MIQQERRFVFLFLAVVLAHGFASAQGIRKHTSIQQGQFWLKWDSQTRDGFVRGYLEGYRTAFIDACMAAEDVYGPAKPKKKPSDLPLNHCFSRQPKFSKAPEYYQGQMTQFYESYPSDLGLPVSELLRLLAEPENKSPAEVHAWYKAERGDK